MQKENLWVRIEDGFDYICFEKKKEEKKSFKPSQL